MKKTSKALVLISIALVGTLGVPNARPVCAAEAWAGAETVDRTLRVQFRVDEKNRQCLPLDNKKNFLQDHFQLLLQSPEVSRHFRILGSGPLSALYGNAELCAKARTVILEEASKQGGHLERTLRIVYHPKVYKWSGDICFEAEREFASLFIGIETGFGDIGPSVTGHARQDHFKVENRLCPDPEYPY
jgi:hypothetical protein